MKVVFKVIKAGSGNDMYFQRLSEALKSVHIESVIEYYPKYYQYFPWLLKHVNKNSSGDIIHTNVEYGWVFKEHGKPLFVTLLHNVFENEFQKTTSIPQKIYHYGILKPNITKSLHVADKIIAISNYTKKSFEHTFQATNINVVYPCINTNIYKPLKIQSQDKRFKLLFVGNLIKRKGVDLLPKIMKALGSKYVLYYTSGLRSEIPDEFKIENMIPLGKLSEKELVKEYNKCDALLFPTRLEGFGFAVAEAMACGKPIISSNNSSIPEICIDKENGYLVMNLNSSDFVKAINKLVATKSQESFTRNREKIVNNIDYKVIASAYEKLISKI